MIPVSILSCGVKVIALTTCIGAHLAHASALGAYVALSIGAGILQNLETNASNSIPSKLHSRAQPSTSARIGYSVTPEFAIELGADFRPLSYDFEIMSTTHKLNQKVRSCAAYLGLTFTLPSFISQNFDLYLTGAIGYARNRVKASYAHSDHLIGDHHFVPGSSTSSLMWSAGIGARSQIDDSLSLELLYRYVSLGFVSAPVFVGPLTDMQVQKANKRLVSNEFSIGLLWAV